MSRKSCNFIVKGNRTFIQEFEKMLEENKITHSKPQYEKPIVQTHARVETEKGVEREMVFHNVLNLLISKETIELFIAMTPIFLDMINRWYISRKKNGEKGEILIRTKKGTFEISAESIRKFVFTEGETRKSKNRKKANRARNKQVRNPKSAQQQKIH